ncbi:MAG: PEP/pyruvate-binding domain-containing protein, partial [Anaerolineales bacterium]|nr:PEP/pyruvate-binding domain-containing protein [Anaerolineales bacterium]
GQQDTYLNIREAEAVLEATRRCWASLWTARAIGYRAHQNISPERVALAVVVQLLIAADAAGILFTANPLNGRRDQMLVNASWGLGEAVVGGQVTPDTITIDKASQAVIKRETAEKLVQTVRTSSGTDEVPVPEDLRLAAVLADEEAARLAELGGQIEGLYSMPMDIEWVIAEGKFHIVQARPITALPDPEPPAPTEWQLPPGAYAAMRNNIVELMADPLTPLFRTLGLSAVNASWNRLLFAFFGKTGIMPEDPIIAVNEYAYYNGSVKIGPLLKVILDTRGVLKRMFSGAVERWTETGRPQYVEIVQGWETKQWRALPTTELLGAVRQLTEAAVDAYGALVSGVLPAAWMSEAWFTFRYKFIKRKDDPSAPAYLMGFDSVPIRSEKALYDLAQWAQTQASLTEYLLDTPTADLSDQPGRDQAPEGLDPDEWRNWQVSFQDYLKEYGHMIYNLDFGNPVPADDPAPVLETFKLFLSGEGINPHERQQAAVDRREGAIQAVQARLKGRRLKSFQRNLARAQKYAPLREDGLADVGL